MRRDSRIDTFRGLALVFMTGAHLPLAAQDYFRGTLGFATFTQVFFFLSGLVAGLVYARRVESHKDRELKRRIGRRLLTIWLAHLLTFAILLAAVNVVRSLGSPFLPGEADLLVARPGVALLLGSVFLYLPAYTSILPLYCLFALLVAPAVSAMMKGRTLLVLSLSGLAWVAAQFGLEDLAVDAVADLVPAPLAPIRILGKQLVFVGGLAFGVALARGLLSRFRVSTIAALAMLGAHAVLFAARHSAFPDGALTDFLWRNASRVVQGPVRLLDFALVLGLAAYVSRAAPRLVTWGWLSLLGRHSLAVFTFHLIPVCTLALVGAVDLPVQVALASAAIASLTLPAWLAERRSSRPAN